MPSSTSCECSDSETKAAWLRLDATEGRLEDFLRETKIEVAAVGGMAYYLDEQGQMFCAPLGLDNKPEKENAFHRTEYELGADELDEITGQVSAWLEMYDKRDFSKKIEANFQSDHEERPSSAKPAKGLGI